MKPIIGILYRDSYSEANHKIKYIYNDIESSIIKSGGIPIGISNDDILPYLSICNGFILQGGDDPQKKDLKLIKILHKKNIPLLGICLGMQEMALALGGEEKEINNHHHIKGYHEVTITRDSLLYKILNTDKIMVNSRHHSTICKTNLKQSATSNDNVLEAIEDHDKTFFIGLQWHPENMYNNDLNSRKIFDYFIKICND